MNNHSVIMIVPESNIGLLETELKEVLTNNDILVKVISDDSFRVMFNIECETIQVDIEDDAFLTIAKMAHDENVTFNEMVTKILRKQIEKKEKENDSISNS